MKYLQVLISAENEGQANKILDALLKKRLITGSPILKGPAKFWWKEKIVEMNYCYLITFTKEKNRQNIIDEVKKVSVEEAPMITFVSIEGNEELLKYINEAVL